MLANSYYIVKKYGFFKKSIVYMYSVYINQKIAFLLCLISLDNYSKNLNHPLTNPERMKRPFCDLCMNLC